MSLLPALQTSAALGMVLYLSGGWSLSCAPGIQSSYSREALPRGTHPRAPERNAVLESFVLNEKNVNVRGCVTSLTLCACRGHLALFYEFVLSLARVKCYEVLS